MPSCLSADITNECKRSGGDLMCAILRAALLYAKFHVNLLGEHNDTVNA